MIVYCVHLLKVLWAEFDTFNYWIFLIFGFIFLIFISFEGIKNTRTTCHLSFKTLELVYNEVVSSYLLNYHRYHLIWQAQNGFSISPGLSCFIFTLGGQIIFILTLNLL